MRPLALLPWLRPVGPVAVGISLGFTLSLLSISWVEQPCPGPPDSAGLRVRHANSVPAGPGPPANPDSPAVPDNPDNFQPRIVPYTAARSRKPTKKTVRTRYISTELGMRERLLVAVLTCKTTLNTLGVAVNRTLAGHTDKVLFFTGVRGRRLPHGMYVVTHGEERPVWNMYHTLRYVFQHHASEYDWFYFTPDNTYTQGDRLRALVGHMSIDTDLYMGRPQEVSGGDGTGRYCRAEFGFLLSRQLLAKLQPHLDSCRTDIISSRHDEWLGRCVLDYLAVTCTHLHQGSRYRFYELGKGGERDGEEGAGFRGAMTLHPVLEPVQMFLLHKRFTQLELEHTYRQIQALQEELRNVSGLDSEAGVQGTLDNWPLGIHSPFRPGSRFEVLRWEYFSEERLCWCADGAPQCPLRGADRLDVAAIVATAVSELNRRHAPWLELTKERLVNGYRRFDPTRGMEYTLDLRLRAATARGRSASITRRVHLLRPLGPLDIVPMPHVTESARVHLLLPITSGQRPHTGPFLRHYADTALVSGDNALLTLVLVYSPAEAQRLGTDDVFAAVKAELGQWERRYPGSRLPWVSVRSLSPAPLRLIDLVSRRQAADALLLLLSAAARPGPELLNRCRMNAISQRQVFFPVPFQEFTVGSGSGSGSGRPELLRDSGHFDRDSFTTACFYNADYMAARVRAASAPANPAALGPDTDELLDGLDLYQLFLQFSGLHVLRAAEPALLHAAGRRQCHPHGNDDLYQRCRRSDLTGLGSRAQLAALLFPPEQSNST